MFSLLIALFKEPQFGKKDLWTRIGLRARFLMRFCLGIISLVLIFLVAGWIDFGLSGGAIFSRFFLVVFGSCGAMYVLWSFMGLLLGHDSRLKSLPQKIFFGLIAGAFVLGVISASPPGDAIRRWQHSSYSWRSDVKAFYTGLYTVHFLREKCRQVKGEISHKRCVCEVLPQVSEQMEGMVKTLQELPGMERAGVRIRPSQAGWVIYNYNFARTDWTYYIGICNN